jgi:soluble cytochrome b562
MIAEHMADRVAQGVYNYMKQMLKVNAYVQNISDKLINDGITSLKLVVTPDDIMSIRSLVQNKFNTNADVQPLADMVSGMGGKLLSRKERDVAEATRSFAGVGMVPPKMPAMMPVVAAKQETPEGAALKTLKIGFMGKSKEMQGQLSILHATMKKTFDITKIEANCEVLVNAGKACNEKLTDSDYDFEQEMIDFNEEIEDVVFDINEALDTLAELVKTFTEKANVVVGTIDDAIAEL